MPVIRVGVQANSTSAGQKVDIDAGRANVTSLANASAEGVQYSTNSGSSWVTVAAGASAAVGDVTASGFRVRRQNAGGYPLAIDVTFSPADAPITGTASDQAAFQALVSGALIPGGRLDTRRRSGGSRRSAIAQWQTAFGGYTWRQAIAVPGHVTAVRVAFPANPSGTWTVDKFYVGSADTAGSVELGSGGAWTPGTFDDGTSASKVIPQAVLPIGYQATAPFDHYLSDWIPVTTLDVTGKTYKIVLVSLYSSTTNTATVNNSGGDNSTWQTVPALPIWDAFKVGDLANGSLSGSSNPQTIPVLGIQWMTGTPAISIGSFADSIDYGASLTPPGIGWPVGTAASLTTLTGGAVSCLLAAQSGDTVLSSMNRFRRAALRGSLPDICIFRPYSRNVPIESLAIRMSYAEEFVQRCLSLNKLPVLSCGIAETTTPANNATMDATSAALVTYCAARGVPLLRLDQIITPANAATLLADGIHPNATGDAALVAYAAPVLQPYAAALLA